MEIKEAMEIFKNTSLFNLTFLEMDAIRFVFDKIERGELVEVVHCKHCKHWNGGTCGYWTDDMYKPAIDENEYCSNGVRK